MKNFVLSKLMLIHINMKNLLLWVIYFLFHVAEYVVKVSDKNVKLN